VNGIAPSYLQEYVIYPPSSRCSLRLRSADTGQLYVPRTRIILGERAFAVAGPRAWSSLPVMVRSAPSLSTFKSYLKAFLFRCAFNTRVTYWLFIHLHIYILFFFHPYFTSAVGLHFFVVQRPLSDLSCTPPNKLACYIHTYIHSWLYEDPPLHLTVKRRHTERQQRIILQIIIILQF